MSKSVPVRFAESAVEDLEDVKEWYRQQGAPAVGQRLISEVVARTEQLRCFPKSGPVVPEFNNPLIRQLIQKPFRIVYRYDEKEVAVVRVWRSERLMVPDGLDL